MILFLIALRILLAFFIIKFIVSLFIPSSGAKKKKKDSAVKRFNSKNKDIEDGIFTNIP